MKTKNQIGFWTILMVAFIFLGACAKTDEVSEADLGQAEEEAIAEAYFADALNDAEDVGSLADLGSYQNFKSSSVTPNQPGSPPVSGERIVTVTPAEGQSDYPGFPKLITIQFIEWKVGQGRLKNGIIKIYTTGPLRRPNTTRIITFENYTVNGNLTEGKKTISNIDGINFTEKLEGGKITFGDGTFITRQMERNRKWIAGTGTPFFIWDDEYQITGSTNGVNRKGKEYSHKIVVPLHRKMSCLWIVAGAVEMKRENNVVTLDYGVGECDNTATITANGETKVITLPEKPRPKPRP